MSPWALFRIRFSSRMHLHFILLVQGGSREGALGCVGTVGCNQLGTGGPLLFCRKERKREREREEERER